MWGEDSGGFIHGESDGMFGYVFLENSCFEFVLLQKEDWCTLFVT